MRENMATLAYQMRTARTVSGWVPGWESNAPLIAKALSILSGNGDLKKLPGWEWSCPASRRVRVVRRAPTTRLGSPAKYSNLGFQP
jgi:hypothetical protein